MSSSQEKLTSTHTLLENARISSELVEANQCLSGAVPCRQPHCPWDPGVLLNPPAKGTCFNLLTPLCLKHSYSQLLLNLVHINYTHIDVRSINRS